MFWPLWCVIIVGANKQMFYNLMVHCDTVGGKGERRDGEHSEGL